MESNDILSAAGRQMSQRSESSDSNSHVCYLFFSIFTLKKNETRNFIISQSKQKVILSKIKEMVDVKVAREFLTRGGGDRRI
jgi:hypothetical protein